MTQQKNITYKQIASGLEYFVKEHRVAPVLSIQCVVHVGSIAEKFEERGMCHFIEHMLFKGTKRYPNGEIGSMIEAVGGDINAYTTFDKTVFYFTIPSQHFELGMDLLSDALFESLFTPEEMEREREVIIEEIKRSLDDPSSVVGRKIFSEIYAGTSAAIPILGDQKSVGGFSRDELYQFYKSWYTPQNMSLILVGDLPELDQTEKQIKKFFGREKAQVSRKIDFKVATPKKLNETKVILIKGAYNQPRLEVAYLAPELEDDRTISLDVGAFILGGSDISRFNVTLRDEQHVVSGAGVSVYSPSFPGLTELSVQTDEENYLEAAEGLGREFGAFFGEKPATKEEIERAVNSMRVERYYRDETVSGQARGIVLGIQTKLKHEYDMYYWKELERVTPDTIQKSLKDFIDPSRVVIVGLLPESSTITEEDLKNKFLAGLNGKSTFEASKPIRWELTSAQIQNKSSKKPETHILNIHSNLSVIYKHVSDFPLASMVAVTDGGLRGETDQTAGYYNAFTDLMCIASETKDHIEISKYLENRGGSISGFSGKDTFGFQIHGLAKDFSELTTLAAELFFEPEFPEEIWKSSQMDILDSLRSLDDSASGLCIRRLQELVFGKHPYRFSTLGKIETIQDLDVSTLKKYFASVRDQGKWVLSAIGPFDPQSFQKLLQSLFSNWKPATARKLFENNIPSKPTSERTFLEKDKEQTHLALAVRSLKWEDPRKPALDLLNSVLAGFGGRLFMELREKNSLAYTVSPLLSYGVHNGFFGTYIGCSYEKQAVAEKMLRQELMKLTEEKIDERELLRSKEFLIGSHQISLQKLSSQSMTMALMELYGLGYSEYEWYPEAIRKVTSNDILQVARDLLVDKTLAVSTVGRN